jgi:hypothetical protein
MDARSTSVTHPAGRLRATFRVMQTTRYQCHVCERDEQHCECDRYCILCFGEDNVRLCEDGSYYCINCREVCDFVPQQ